MSVIRIVILAGGRAVFRILFVITVAGLVPQISAQTPLPRFVTTSVPDSLPDPTHPALLGPSSPARLELGRKLFFERRLSSGNDTACADCHVPEHGFADARPQSIGTGGQVIALNAPTLFNRYLGSSFMWDGRFDSLEQQTLAPIDNPQEMGLGVDRALTWLRDNAGYQAAFRAAWPPQGRIGREELAGSLAHFIRHIRIGDSPVDRYQWGDDHDLTGSEIRGFQLYSGRAQCWRCHLGADYTDEHFHATGIGAEGDGIPHPGRYLVTDDVRDLGRFKTPTLRGLAFTAPYMHDGSKKTLRAVVDFYAEGGQPNSNLDPEVFKLRLSERDREDLVAFLLALSR
ncbi:MAG: c-type cytochrome [Planctomycetes bacterium]|nr:c-type cytochrome [Planctomycetota bacterium]